MAGTNLICIGIRGLAEQARLPLRHGQAVSRPSALQRWDRWPGHGLTVKVKQQTWRQIPPYSRLILIAMRTHLAMTGAQWTRHQIPLRPSSYPLSCEVKS